MNGQALRGNIRQPMREERKGRVHEKPNIPNLAGSCHSRLKKEERRMSSQCGRKDNFCCAQKEKEAMSRHPHRNAH